MPVGILNTGGCYDLLEQLLDRSAEEGFLDSESRKCAEFYTDAKVMLDDFEKESGLYDYPFIPLWDEASEVLILGSYPSVKSRETGFFTDTRKTGSGKRLPVCLRMKFLRISSTKKNFFTGTILHCGML